MLLCLILDLFYDGVRNVHLPCDVDKDIHTDGHLVGLDIIPRLTLVGGVG